MAKNGESTPATLVVGHQRPDTDSAVSACVYAALLNATSRDGERFEGVMLGAPSRQTRWLFDSAGVKLPRQVSDLIPRVRDAARRKVLTVGTKAALGDALRLITTHHISVVPVVGEDGRLEGVLSDRMPLASYFYHANPEDFLGVLLSLEDITRYLRLEQWQAPARPADGRLVLDPAGFAHGCVVLAGDQPELAIQADAAGAAAIIVCARKKTLAWRRAIRSAPDLGLFRFNGSLMALAAEIGKAIPVDRIMLREETPRLGPDQTLPEAQAVLRRAPFSLPVVNADGTLFGVLSRSELLNFRRPRVVLVDHFEHHQAPEGIAEAEITEIVDHHRVGTLETTLPIRVDCRPVGSTATIIACKFAELGLRPTPAQARLLLGAIIADTLLLQSPTTAEVDRRQARALAIRARVQLEKFGRNLLLQNDETRTRPAAELIERDLKEFSGNGLKFAVAQIETVDRRRIPEAQIKDFCSALRRRRERGAWDLALLMITDVLRRDSLVMVDAANPVLARKLLKESGRPEVWPGCVSRKKQLLPELLTRLSVA